MKKPRVITKCPANAGAAPNERIIEFSALGIHGPVGGLISFRIAVDGTLIVDVYRTDEHVRVLQPRRGTVTLIK